MSATAAGIFITVGKSVSPAPACCSKSIADEFLTKLKAQARHWQPGDPLDPDSTMGMLIDAAHADTVHTFIREGTRKGTLLLDGREQSWPSAVGPTIFVDIDSCLPAVPGRDFRAGAGRDPF